jgi:iron complex transport system permease protein
MTAALRVTGGAEQGKATSAKVLIVAVAAGLFVAAFLAVSIGPTGITLASLPRVLWAMLTGRGEPEVAREQLVLIDIRLPRLLLGMFVGASLAVAGAMMQGMFRNPLADPGLIGVSSGAAVAAVATIALGNSLAAPWIRAFGAYALPLAAFCGGITTTAILVGISRR